MDLDPAHKNESTRRALLAPFLLLTLILAACDGVVGRPPTLAPTLIPISAAIEEDSSPAAMTASAADRDQQPDSLQPPATYTAQPTVINAPTSTLRPTTAIAPTSAAMTSAAPTPNPFAGLSIAELSSRDYGGGLLEIIDTLETNEQFTRYWITYPSDGLTIHGFMNVPNEGSRFPVAIMLHGYVPPDQYRTLDYTTRYADHLAEAGYLVLHPNLRGFPPSDGGPDPFRVGLAVDVLNLIAIIRQQSQDPTGYLRRADAGDINLWGHSMGGGVTLRVITVDNSPYIRSAVLYGAMSGDEAQNYEKIHQWSAGESGDFELAAPLAILRTVSPIYFLDRINTPVSIHHGAADDVVPPEWSDDLCRRLTLLNNPVECFSYEAMPHTFLGANDQLFMDRTAAFFDRQ